MRREECTKLLSGPKKLRAASKPRKARPPKLLPKPDPAQPAIGPPSTPDKLTREAAAAGQHSFTTPVPASSGSKRGQPGGARSIQPTVLADRFCNADMSAPVPSNKEQLAAPHAQKGGRSRVRGKEKAAGGTGGTRPGSEADGGALVSDDNLSMTGLVDSQSDSFSDEEAMTNAPAARDAGSSSQSSAGSGSEDSDSSAAHRRQAKKFIAAAPTLAAPAMQPKSDAKSDAHGNKEQERQEVVESHAEQPAAVFTDVEVKSCEDASDSDESEASLGSPLGIAGGSRLPSLALSESEQARAGARSQSEDSVMVRSQWHSLCSIISEFHPSLSDCPFVSVMLVHEHVQDRSRKTDMIRCIEGVLLGVV